MKQAFFNLSGKWRFGLDLKDVGEHEGWFRPEFDHDTWLSVDVPSNWDFYKPELFGYSGVGWYKRTFTLSDEWAQKRVILKFEGVNYSTKVWVNGVHVGSHEGGFMPFEFDISQNVKFCEENCIVVRVENTPAQDKVPSSLAGWWNFGGIFRDIYLEFRDTLHFDDVAVFANPDGDMTCLRLLFKVANKGQKTARLKVDFEVTTMAGHVIISWGKEPQTQIDINVKCNACTTSELEIKVNGLKPWSIQDPNLYILKAFLRTPDDQVLDSVSTTFGIRSISIKEGKFYLNNKPIVIKGVNRHEEYPNNGRVDKRNLLESDLRMIKNDLAANMIRIHYLCDSEFYDVTDRLGLLVFAEIPAWQISKEAMKNPKVIENMRQQLAELIGKLKNHPSVVVWSVGNESETDNEVARSVISELIEYVRNMDPTRPVTYVSSYIYREDKWCRCLDLGDFTSINAYFDVEVDKLNQVVEKIHVKYPNRPILLTEFGAEAVRGLHGNFVGGEEHQAEVIEKTFDLIMKKDHILGSIVWSFTDYWHQPRILGTKYLNPIYYLHGILDLDRRPKKAFKVLSRLYSEKS